MTTVPTHKLPGMFSYGSSTPAEIAALDDVGELDSMTNDDGTRGQILWIRGLTRLQHQVCTYVSYWLFWIKTPCILNQSCMNLFLKFYSASDM